MKPTLGRVVQVKGGVYDGSFPPDEWHAAFVVREPFAHPSIGECFSVQVFSRYCSGFRFESHSVDGEGKTWRWPPRETA